MKSKKTMYKAKSGNKPSLDAKVSPSQELRFFGAEEKGAPARLRRTLTLIEYHTATSGSNFSYAAATGKVTTALEWAALSASYQQYRVRAIEVRIVPRNIFNNGFAATVWFPGTILGARYPAGSSASSYAAIFGESGSKVWSESQMPLLMATMNDNPDSALFADCNAGAPPALSQYGVQFLGSIAAPAIYNGVITHDVFVKFDVEFIARN